MFRQGRSLQPPLPVSYSPPPVGGSMASRPPPRRGASRRALALSLAFNAALLLTMLYHSYAGGLPQAVVEALGDSPPAPTIQLAAAAGWRSSQSSSTEAMLEGLHEDAAGLVSHLSRHAVERQQQQRELAHDALGIGRPGGTSHRRYWLTVGIPTVHRSKSNTTYLTATLESLLDELPGDPLDLMYGRVRVFVMNNDHKGHHPEFERLRSRAQQGAPGDLFAAKAAAYIEFLDNPGTITDPAPDMPDPDDLNNPEDIPGRHVRKQTCDLIALLQHATPLSDYYLFMEDDFEVCPYALRALQYVLSKANSLKHLDQWLALRVSYGMNGVLMRNEDLPQLSAFLWEYITVKPPDLLWAEYLERQAKREAAQQQGAPLHTDRKSRPVHLAARRPFVVYKYNLMAHLGTISSFEVRPDRKAWPGCYASMSRDVWSLQMHERFAARCHHTDLSPCLSRGQGGELAERWVGLPLDWALGSGQQRQQSLSGSGRRSGAVPANHTSTSTHAAALLQRLQRQATQE